MSFKASTQPDTAHKKNRSSLSSVSRLTLFFDPTDHYSHRIRLAIAKKDIPCALIAITNQSAVLELAELNPYLTLPILADREISLYETSVILEYLDERYPHPSLLPTHPAERANSRLLIHRIQWDWCTQADLILHPDSSEAERRVARKALRESLISISQVFVEKPYFISDKFSILDCCLLPILWRLPELGIELPTSAKSLLDYMRQQFDHTDFLASLSSSGAQHLGDP